MLHLSSRVIVHSLLQAEIAELQRAVTGIEEPAGGTSSLIAGGEGQNKGQKKSSSFKTSTPEEKAASTLSTSAVSTVEAQQ
jgi:hypothetical protein